MELSTHRNLLDVTWLLDISRIPALGAPTKANGMLRRNGRHNAYVVPGEVTIRSDPVKLPLIRMRDFVTNSFAETYGVTLGDDEQSIFWELRAHFSRTARGLVVY